MEASLIVSFGAFNMGYKVSCVEVYHLAFFYVLFCIETCHFKRFSSEFVVLVDALDESFGQFIRITYFHIPIPLDFRLNGLPLFRTELNIERNEPFSLFQFDSETFILTTLQLKNIKNNLVLFQVKNIVGAKLETLQLFEHFFCDRNVTEEPSILWREEKRTICQN